VAVSAPAASKPEDAVAAAQAPRKSIDPARAHVAIANVAVRSAVSKASVRCALNMGAIDGCYRDALRARSAPEESVTGQLELAADVTGNVTRAALDAPQLPAALRQCVEGVVKRSRVRESDTGQAQATIALNFEPG
jgi:chitodextrinase